MKTSTHYLESVNCRLKCLRYDEFVTHGQLMNFEGFISAGISFGQFGYCEYFALWYLAKNAYDNNTSKLS